MPAPFNNSFINQPFGQFQGSNGYSYPQPTPIPQSQPQSLIRVNGGLEGAKTYPTSPGDTVAIFDNTENLMFIKSTDQQGFSSIRTFRYDEIDISNEANDNVSREEFEQLKRTIEGMMSNGQESVSGQSGESTQQYRAGNSRSGSGKKANRNS